MKKVLVLGAGGFIGHHMAARLAEEGCEVFGADVKRPEFTSLEPFLEFTVADLSTDRGFGAAVGERFYDEVYQFAADMGGAGYIFTGEHDLRVMVNSGGINLQVVRHIEQFGRTFYASSACIYPAHNQEDPNHPNCREDTAYPAAPDSEYGWEKLFSERLYLAAARNLGAEVRVARYHNIYGPEGTYQGGREKAPAAICRKVAAARSGDSIEIWGDGKQTRSFLYIDDCIDATLAFMRGDFEGPINIGSEEMVSINELVEMVAFAAGKQILVDHIPGPLGVRGRNSHNELIRQKLGWEPQVSLLEGITKTYRWIAGRNA